MATVTDNPQPQPASPELAPAIARALASLRGRIRRYVSLEGLALALAWLGLAFWLSLLIDWLPVTFGYDELTVGGRIAVLAVAAGAMLAIVYLLVLRRLVVALPDRSLAVLLERRFRAYQDSLLTTVEMREAPEHAAAFNEDMLERTCEDALEKTGQVKLSEVFNPWPMARNVLLALVFGLSIGAFAYAQGEAFETWVSRFLLLNDATKWTRRCFVMVDGQYPRKIAKGDDITIVVKAEVEEHETPRSVRLEYVSEGDRPGPEDDTSGSVSMTRIGEPQGGFQEFSYTFHGLLHTIKQFEVVGGDYRVRGDQYKIDVVDSPGAELKLVVEYPTYTNLATQTLDVRGTMEVPKGSRVTVLGVANKPLRQATVEITYGEATARPKLRSDVPLAPQDPSQFRLVIQDLQGQDLQGMGRVDRLLDTQDLHFTLDDEDGIRTRQPIVLSITAVEDQAPQAEIRLHHVGDAVTPQVRIPFEGKISDQYGVTKLFIKYTRAGEEPVLIPFKQDPKGRQEIVLARERMNDKDFDEEVLDFQTLAYEMRKQRDGASKAGLPPKRAPREPDPKAKADPKAKPAIVEEIEDSQFQLTPGQTFTLQIVARDGCTLPRTVSEGYSSVFAFRVVTPEELRLILAERERIQRKNFERYRDEVTLSRDSLADVHFDPPADEPPGKEPGKAAGKEPSGKDSAKPEKARKVTADDLRLEAFLRAQRAQQVSAKNAIEVLEVAAYFEIIRGELENNRLYNEELRKRLQLGVIDPLNHIGKAMFPQFDGQLNDFVDKCDKAYDNPVAREEARLVALRQADKIVTEMNGVLANMAEFEQFNEAIRILREIIEAQDRVNQATKKMQNQSLPGLGGP
jgi:hypothetical protein